MNLHGCDPVTVSVRAACREEDATDPQSRHKGKLDTESLLQSKGVNFTSVRPVYIYGPLNYNPVEEWFFHRLKAGRPILVPNSGMQVRPPTAGPQNISVFTIFRSAPGYVYMVKGYVARCASGPPRPGPQCSCLHAGTYDLVRKLWAARPKENRVRYPHNAGRGFDSPQNIRIRLK